MRSHYSDLLQAAALTNRGANQAAGQVCRLCVCVFQSNEMVIAETFLLVYFISLLIKEWNRKSLSSNIILFYISNNGLRLSSMHVRVHIMTNYKV